jgi:hypothetical protein
MFVKHRYVPQGLSWQCLLALAPHAYCLVTHTTADGPNVSTTTPW